MVAHGQVARFAASLVGIAFWFGLAGAASATIFVPPNNTVGHVFTTNANDAWSASRGVVFHVDATQTLSSIGLYQDLTGVTVAAGALIRFRRG